MKIAIDPGHGMSNRKAGVYDPGAVARGHNEAEIALSYALCLKHFLNAEGIGFFLTRASASDPAPLRERVRRAEAAGCTHLVSLHLNASKSPKASGIEALYRSDAYTLLAARLLNLIVADTPLKLRGIKQRRDLAILKFYCPAVLIELGFISNDGDRKFLLLRDSRIKICRAIAEALTS